MIYRWICPACSSHDLSVMVVVSAALVQEPDGKFQTELDNSDHDWDGGSNMTCNICFHCDAAGAFEVQP